MSAIFAAIEEAYKERTDFLVIALTGRTGSGCTTTANILSSEFSDITTLSEGLPEIEKRKLSIARNYCAKQWVPFKKISVSTVIFSFLLDVSRDDLDSLLVEHRIEERQKFIDLIGSLKGVDGFESFNRCVNNGERNGSAEAWEYYAKWLSNKSVQAKEILGEKYTKFFQALGNRIRFSGNASTAEENPKELFTLIRRVKRIAKAAFIFDQEVGVIGSTRIVIDAVRNPLELVYLRDQFAAFYAVAITAEDDDRKSRLDEAGFTKKQISDLDEKEYPEQKKYLDSYENFVSQNLQECIQKADIFLANNGTPSNYEEKIRSLNTQIIRYVALILRPGLITPTRDERCMQLAFVAKLNSGCISRQVGAAIADRDFSIKAVGWNDIPKGQVPCLLRNVDELVTGNGGDFFSTFEKTDQKFKNQIKKTYQNRKVLEQSGLPCPFCFKREYNALKNEKNQVHTRSLHAEENAFLQLARQGNTGIQRGFLYTTASPCELCSKKAFQLGISEIVYVDPYPGISSSHILSSGLESYRPKIRLFSGAIGHAYHRLYDPILPIKDEHLARLTQMPEQADLL